MSKKNNPKDVVIALLFFAAFYISLNVLERSVSNQLIGIAFLIAFIYTSINVLKGKKVF